MLAEKIFNIMEGTSDITEHVNDTRHIDGHPGTMNFKQRLCEAQRIHERNRSVDNQYKELYQFEHPPRSILHG